jgi:hypothetical protein
MPGLSTVVHAVDRGLRGQALLVALLAAHAALLAALAPYLLHEDTWLTLVAGREVWREGIPTHDGLAVVTAGRSWVDQQWLAQLVFYGADAVGGLPLMFVLHLTALTAAVGLAFASVRRRGASSVSVFAIALLALLVAPWVWQPRAQSLAEPLFVAVLALLLHDPRGPSRRRTLLVLPLLAMWANVHGSVLLGVALTVAYAALGLADRRAERRWTAGSVALLLSPLCLVLTPYGLRTIAYYGDVLGNGEIASLAPEWGGPSGSEAFPFFLLVAVTVGLVAFRRRAVGRFELIVMGATLAASLTAVRHFVWFALAATMILPLLLPGPAPRPATPLGRWVGWASVGALATILVVLAVRPEGWYEQRWPDRAGRALAAAARQDADATVFVHGREADWLLWRHPSLAGRIAYDARLELLSADEIRTVVRFDRGSGRGWQAAADGYPLVWINARLRPELAATMRGQRGAEVVYQDDEVTLVRRPSAQGRLS